jgi:Peptidase M50B-like
MLSLSKNTEILLVLSIALGLNYLPKIGRVFKGFNTLVHESGHAFMTLLFSGEVVSVELFHTGEGLAVSKSKSWFTKFFVSMAGYPFSSIVSFVFAYFIFRNKYDYVLYSVISLSIINLIFWVRNPYGLVWLIVLLASLFSFFYFDLEQVKYYAALTITAFIFTDAWISAWHVLYLSIREPKKAGDAKNLQSFALLPAFFWGLFFWIQASYFMLLSIHLFVPLPFQFLELGILQVLHR